MTMEPKLKRDRWSKFWWDDWSGDLALQSCSLGARGLWMEMLSLMNRSDQVGYLTIAGRPLTVKQLAAFSCSTEKEVGRLLSELRENGVFSTNSDGFVYCRRMLRDIEYKKDIEAIGKLGGNPEIRRGTVPKADRVRPYKRSDSPAKTNRIFAKNDGRCVWCQIMLQRQQAGPDFFHVDHRIPVCDGGTNDEENLVPACASCNHLRARITDPTGSPSSDTTQSDTNGSGIPTPTSFFSDTNPDTNLLEAEAEADIEVEKESRKIPPKAPQGGGRVVEEAFEEFYRLYPRKKAPAFARKAFLIAVKNGTPPETIIAGLRGQLARREFSADPTKQPHPTTWLHGGCWANEPDKKANPQYKNGFLGLIANGEPDDQGTPDPDDNPVSRFLLEHNSDVAH